RECTAVDRDGAGSAECAARVGEGTGIELNGLAGVHAHGAARHAATGRDRQDSSGDLDDLVVSIVDLERVYGGCPGSRDLAVAFAGGEFHVGVLTRNTGTPVRS